MRNCKRHQHRMLIGGTCVVAWLYTFGIFGCLAWTSPRAAFGERINAVLATVDGEPVTLYEVKRFAKTSLRLRQSTGLSEAELLRAVITDKIVEREVQQKGIIVRDEDVDAYIRSVKERNRIDDRQLEEALKAQGLDMATYRKQVREDLARQQLLAREIRGKVTVTPEDVQRYLDEHKEEYIGPARVRIAHIFFPLPPDAGGDQVAATLARAEEVRRQIADGLDFAVAAQRYSQDKTGREGGDLGWFKPGELVDELERAQEQLKVGEVSPPVRTRLGIHLIRVLAREQEGSVDRSVLEEEVRQKLYSQALEERFQRWLSEDLYKLHHVEIFAD
ncbi:MAG: peptidylprolyl isomerase [Candidatus Binatia bacterium]|nr:peptidylprolyl isomerase [Candidatus Binatia bacterium]